METLYLQLLEFPESVTVAGFPDHRRAYIALKTVATEKCHTEEGECAFPVISAECRSRKELLDALVVLLRELLSIYAEGCRFLGGESRYSCQESSEVVNVVQEG